MFYPNEHFDSITRNPYTILTVITGPALRNTMKVYWPYSLHLHRDGAAVIDNIIKIQNNGALAVKVKNVWPIHFHSVS